MDYGPFLSTTVQVARDNIAYKGIAIRLDEGPGGVARGSQFMVFDTDTLRWAGAWSGEGFINWRGIAFDGAHQAHPAIVGELAFANPAGPGWARPGSADFSDVRLRGRDGRHYGPLPRDWAHWKGLYRQDGRIVLSYTVGAAAVLESPGMESANGIRAWTRTLDIGPRPEDLLLQVAQLPGGELEIHARGGTRTDAVNVALLRAGKNASAAGAELVFDGRTHLEIENASGLDLHGGDFTLAARVLTTAGGTIVAQAPRTGPWAPNGKTFFVRGGRLAFDIGWVGAVQSKRRVDDGKWHDVAMTFEHKEGRVRFYIDGKPDGEGQLKAKAPLKDFAMRIGFTAENFPAQSYFDGKIQDLRIFSRALGPEEMAALAGSGRIESGLAGHWRLNTVPEGGLAADLSSQRRAARMVHMEGGRKNLVAALAGQGSGAQWEKGADGQLRLRIPKGHERVRLKVVLAPVADEGALQSFIRLARDVAPAQSLEAHVGAFPRRWPETFTTGASIVGKSDGPYVIEAITEPVDNPWKSWLRFGGFDFFEGGQRAAICTWNGDVWLVDGLGGDFDKFTWQRIASGLFQPLGLRIVNGQIYVTCRDQITRLRDLNGDGETDFYENFNNDAQVTEHFHEFAMDLQTDAGGNFYYAKGGRHALDAVVPQHGTLIKVSPDGSRSEIVAGGFRAPNGVCVNPDGSFFLSDQEGHWTPKNRINRVVPGGFYGYMMGYHEGRDPNDAQSPVTWVHNKYDRSPAEQLWVNSDRWGPLSGMLLNLSYGEGHVHLALQEKVGGILQGGLVRLPLDDFPTGIMRGRFNSKDGQLYACGLFGWSSNKVRPGGFYRVRYSGKPVAIPVGLSARRDGIRISFAAPLDPEDAADAGSYSVHCWNYRRSSAYGSKDFKVSQPTEEGRDELTVASAELSPDRKTVFLRIQEMTPAMQVEIRYGIRAADGARLSQTIHHTIHALAD